MVVYMYFTVTLFLILIPSKINSILTYG
jgi:hypothetical protein